MLLLPAIDLMSGQAVRLRQGRADTKVVYSSDPVAVARRWEDEGGDVLHLVDLDAAFTGHSENLPIIEKISKALTIPCELGGGLRDEKTIQSALNAGVSRVVLGTRAAESMDFVREMVARFGSERIVVGIDAKEGIVAVKGWTESAGRPATDLALAAQGARVGAIIYTDIATDGMMAGPNFVELDRLLEILTCPLIASGGVSTAEDVRLLASRPKLHGAIIGRALYEGTVRLTEVRKVF